MWEQVQSVHKDPHLLFPSEVRRALSLNLRPVCVCMCGTQSHDQNVYAGYSCMTSVYAEYNHGTSVCTEYSQMTNMSMQGTVVQPVCMCMYICMQSIITQPVCMLNMII